MLQDKSMPYFKLSLRNHPHITTLDQIVHVAYARSNFSESAVPHDYCIALYFFFGSSSQLLECIKVEREGTSQPTL